MPDKPEVPIRSAGQYQRQNTNNQLSPHEPGKIPPQARDLEEAILGAFMLEKDALANAIDIMKPEAFYVEAHQHIFNSICQLFEQSQPVDILTVTEQLKKDGKLEECGGSHYISNLTTKVGTGANVESYARIILQKFIQRELIRISNNVIKDAYEDTTDVLDLLDKTEQDLFSVTEQNLSRSYEEIGNRLAKTMEEIETLMNNDEDFTGVPSGFPELDRVTGGWQNSDLIIMAARPGMGKTAFMLSLARNAAIEYEYPVALFSLEMSSKQLVTRMISSEAELPQDKLKNGNLKEYEYVQLQQKAGSLSDSHIFIDDTPALNIFEMRAKCRRMKKKHGIGLIIIDYLQLMHGSTDNKAGNREQEISSISRSLKNVAKDLEVPVIALSQLSRAVETRGGDKKPQLSDLRESGAIEQDADLVVFLYRPEYYDIFQDQDGKDLQGIAEVIVAKHRNGALKDIYLRFVSQYAKFLNLDEDDSQSFPSPPDEDLGDGTNVITRGSKMNDMDDEDESTDSNDSFWNQKPDGDDENKDDKDEGEENDEDVPF